MQEKEVKAVITRSRNYMLLLQYGGPGFLLQIGPDVNALWQHRLKEDDIRVLLKYWKDHLPKLDEQARALAPFASRILAVGMVAFGWSYYELEATSSGLTDSIRQHTDLQQLARDTKDLTIAQSLPKRNWSNLTSPAVAKMCTTNSKEVIWTRSNPAPPPLQFSIQTKSNHGGNPRRGF
ncbi:hypothetical protein BDZ45DRAFT_749032 [Acephala macrosclerotiorum]|nr:hypothetical protein BDZ45DRAFT_749032 [Acephala macrosclerotiorum]